MMDIGEIYRFLCIEMNFREIPKLLSNQLNSLHLVPTSHSHTANCQNNFVVREGSFVPGPSVVGFQEYLSELIFDLWHRKSFCLIGFIWIETCDP